MLQLPVRQVSQLMQNGKQAYSVKTTLTSEAIAQQEKHRLDSRFLSVQCHIHTEP